MKLTVKNFGPVKEAEVEVNNLNILMGDNNGGKTWLSYLVYGALNNFISYPRHLKLLNFKANENYTFKVPKQVNPFHKRKSVVLSETITDFSLDEMDHQEVLSKLFNISYNDPLMNGEFIADFDTKSNFEFFILGSGQSKFEFSLLDEEDENFIFYNVNFSFIEHSDTLIGYYTTINKANSIFFSSERNGINLFHKAFDRHNSNLIQKIQNGSLKANNIEDSINYDSVKVTKPVNDNISFTRDIEFYLVEKAEIDNKTILEIFESLIGGTFSKAPNAQITFDQKDKDGNLIKVPLYLASSAARCLSDLYFYLKHLAKKNDVIFIDEPESHLTLDRQRIMAKLLVAIANAGVKVWVTTHSDFMVREVNNLIKLSTDLPGKQAFLKEYAGEYTEKDCIKPDEVNMYNMEEGIVRKIEITEKGMATDSFLDLAIMKANEIGNAIEYYSDKAE